MKPIWFKSNKLSKKLGEILYKYFKEWPLAFIMHNTQKEDFCALLELHRLGYLKVKILQNKSGRRQDLESEGIEINITEKGVYELRDYERENAKVIEIEEDNAWLKNAWKLI